MPKLPCVSGQKVARAPERLGFERRRQKGSHLVMRRGSAVCVVPMHREVDQGTLRGVLRQAKVSEQEFVEVLQPRIVACKTTYRRFVPVTKISVLTELAMKHCSWARWCNRSSSAGVGSFSPL